MDQLNLNWIVGFTDAEGYFLAYKMGNRRRIVFSISQHETEMQTLEALKSHFGCGYIICNGKNRKVYEYRIFGAKSIISKIIPLFDQFCLKTRKRLDYSDFRKVAFLIQARPQKNWPMSRRLARIGEIDRLIGKMNNKRDYKGYKALQHLDNADWLVGFTEGDGCFSATITKSRILMTFWITQNHLDRSLLLAIKDWFNCGHVYPLKGSRKDNTIQYTVQKRSDLTNLIVPFFEKHPLRTVKKQKDFEAFKSILNILNTRKPLSSADRNELQQIWENKYS